MRSLVDLLASPEGRDLLAERGMHVDRAAFSAALEDPASDDLNDLLGLAPGTRLVHIGQQVCVDYQAATAAKFAAADDLGADGTVTPVVLWHDAYPAESERYGMRMVLPSGSKQVGVWLAPRRQGIGEPRFIRLEPDAVDQALAELRKWVSHRMQTETKDRRREAGARVDALAEAVASEDHVTLSDANAAFAEYLLREHVGVRLPSTRLSTMLTAGIITEPMNTYLAQLEDVVTVFNEAVDQLVADDIDPQVGRLPDDYLPLRYACPSDGARLSLRLVREGADGYATATCRCGADYRFHLGNGTMGLGELGETDRWSPDVSLPIHHRAVASGWIVGRSTALYGLVMNTVIERVLDDRPIPGLIPPDLLDETAAEPAGTSLLVDHLTS